MEVLMPPTAPEHHARYVIFACRALARRVDPARPPWSARAPRAGVRSPVAPRVRHRFVVIVAVALSAGLAGARSFTAIGESVADADVCVLSKLGIATARRPCAATIRRVLARVGRRRAQRGPGGLDACPCRPCLLYTSP